MKAIFLKIVLMVAFMLHFNTSFAQHYFNKLVTDSSGIGKIMYNTDNTYTIVGSKFTSNAFNEVPLVITKLNANGDTLWRKWYADSTKEFYVHCLLKTANNSFIVLCDVYDSTSQYITVTSDIEMLKFDKDGNKLWSKRYYKNDYQFAYSLKLTTDGNYAIAGINADTSANSISSGFLIKTDTLGTIIWQQNYSTTINNFTYMSPTTDKGFILSGSTIDTTSGTNKHHGWILKTDNLGNKEWQKQFGITNNDACYNVLQTQDGNYLFNLRTYDSTAQDYNWDIIKMDNLQNTVWQKTIPVFSNYCLPTIENRDGTFVTAGGLDNNYTITNVIKLSNQGDTLWTRQYSNSSFFTSSTSIDDIQATSDSGYVFRGGGFFVSPNFYSSSWVAKLDCMGADSVHYYFPASSCATTGWGVGIKEELVVDKEELKVYPNPTAGSLTLTLSPSANTQDKLGEGIGEVRVYNVLGECVLYQQLITNNQQLTLDVSSLQKGIYFVQVKFLDVSTGSTQVKSEKFVKE